MDEALRILEEQEKEEATKPHIVGNRFIELHTLKNRNAIMVNLDHIALIGRADGGNLAITLAVPENESVCTISIAEDYEDMKKLLRTNVIRR